VSFSSQFRTISNRECQVTSLQMLAGGDVLSASGRCMPPRQSRFSGDLTVESGIQTAGHEVVSFRLLASFSRPGAYAKVLFQNNSTGSSCFCWMIVFHAFLLATDDKNNSGNDDHCGHDQLRCITTILTSVIS